MRSALLLASILVCVGTTGVWAAAAPAAADSGLVLQIEIGSRLYPTWHEQMRLRLGELFYLGDSEYTARIEQFLPDFRIIDHKFLTVSQELKNPAARIVVYHDTTAADTAWAFLNFPPHFSQRAFFTFQLKEITGFVPAPVDSASQAAVAPTAAPAAAAAPSPAAAAPRPDSLQADRPKGEPHE